MSEFYPRDDRYVGGARTETAQGTAQQARTAASEVAGTARGQAQTVAGEAKDQTKKVIGRLQDRAGEQAQRQSQRAAHQVRLWADELAVMGDGVKPDSPWHGIVRELSGRGRQAADYLEHQGLAGAVQEVQDFARRRPGLFLAGMAAAGFVLGRVAKVATGSQEPPADDLQVPPPGGLQAPPPGGYRGEPL
ncbi:hypothetical protein [Nonomuraea sp. NPDC005501]|uniref:hypothetical protein n=1 Tax=Nonomuraea sp. NPDC005501 TaxID=3156884 RepID=UPI0033A8ACA0